MHPSTIIQLFTIILLILLSAFFSSAETALTTVNKFTLRSMADNGNKRAARVLKLISNSDKLISTILIGNNIVNISASALATTLTTNLFGSKAVGIATGILTLLILLFGEITPKTLAQNVNTVCGRRTVSGIYLYPICIHYKQDLSCYFLDLTNGYKRKCQIHHRR